jgi:integral membrane sensor domain MASE1
MARAGTGGARFPSFSASLSASYLLELTIIAASYFGIAKTAVLVPAINATAMPLWPPTGVALSVILLRGDRVWPAILIGSIFATAITSSPIALLD